MKKIMTILILSIFVWILVGCEANTDLTQLDTPLNLEIDSSTLTFDAVENAKSYLIIGENIELTITSNTHTFDAGTYNIQVIAKADGYLDSEPSESIVFEVEATFDLSKLGYYSYLNDSNPVITITVTGFGIMRAQLFPSVAENTVNNFIDYVNNGQFNGSSFHRVIETFMIQGGIVPSTKAPIEGEFALNGINNPLKHFWGVLSMARTSIPNSATSQFFIMHYAASHLDGAYASFGGLISGFDVLDEIAKVRTNIQDAPVSRVVIERITIELNGYEPKPVIYFGS